jgi:hypothetical protein
MTFEWQVEWASDLSCVWMECSGPGYEMCVQNEYGLLYSVYVFLQYGDMMPDYVVKDLSLSEARAVGEAIVEQVFVDRLGLWGWSL